MGLRSFFHALRRTVLAERRHIFIWLILPNHLLSYYIKKDRTLQLPIRCLAEVNMLPYRQLRH